MRICTEVRGITDCGGYFEIQTNAIPIRIWFLTDDILRIRAGFDGDFDEASYSLVMTAWESRTDKLFADERRRVEPAKAELRILEDDDNVFTKLSGKQSNRRSITFFLIVCSIILLLVDIVFRRFAIGEIVKRLIKKNSSERKKKPAAIKVDYSENSDIIPEADEAITETSKNEVNKVKTEKRKDNKKEKKKDKPVEETLDTSALLKKKKDRNL